MSDQQDIGVLQFPRRQHQTFVSLFKSLSCILAHTPQISVPNIGEFEMENVFSYWDKVRTVLRCPSS